jgi:hypothetical protein
MKLVVTGRECCHTFSVFKEEKHTQEFKSTKDCLTLVLGVNALGDMRLKPLLIYHSQTLRAVRVYCEQHLRIIWRLTQRAWTKRGIFQE